MKRRLVFALCAIGLVATASTSQAQTVQLSLNLRYTDPADPTEGGRWFLMAKTDDADGIAGISAYINNINTAGIVFGNPTAVVDSSNDADYVVVAPTTTGANVNTVGGTPYNTTISGTIINVVYGQDLSSPGGAITANVGQPDAPGNSNFVNDPLQNNTWNNSTLIMSGTFGSVRPTIATNVGPQSNNTDANTLAGLTLGQNAQDAATTIVVRGDALQSSGLEGGLEGLARGDANRDFDVDSDDLDIVLNNFNTASDLWDQGNFDDGGANGGAGEVDSDDLDFVLNNFNTTQTPPSIAAVPEPSSMALVALAAAGLFGLRRRVA